MNETITSAHEWSEEILHEIFRHTPVGVALTDLHGTLLDVNEALCAIVGYSREHVAGRAASSFLHPDDADRSRELLLQIREGSMGSRRATCRVRARSGRYVWVDITVSVVRSRLNEPIFGIAFVEDVSERMEMEKALNESATLYKQVVNDQTEMIVRWKPDGTRTFVNDAYARYFGLPQSDLIGTSFMPLVVAEDRAALEAEVRALTPESPSRTGLHRVIVADGSVRWNEWTDRASFDENGRITILQSIGRDVTDRVDATDALRISEARYRVLFQDLPTPAWEADWSDVVAIIRGTGARSTEEFLRIAAANPEIVRRAISAVNISAINGSALALAEVPDRASFDRWRADLQVTPVDRLIRAVGGMIFEGATMRSANLSIRTALGNVRDVRWQWTRLRDTDSGWRVLIVVLDLTEEKRRDRELDEKQERLENAEAIAHLGHWEIDVETGLVSGSPAYWKIYDGETGGPLVRSITEDLAQIDPRDRERIIPALTQLFSATPGTAPELPKEWQFRLIRGDGKTRWVRSMCHVKVRDGKPPIIYGVDQDITDAKLAVESLRRSEQLYRDLFHNMPVAVWETDWTGVLEELAREGILTPEQFLAAMRQDPQRFSAVAGRRRVIEANQYALDLLKVKDIAGLAKATFPPKVAPEQAATFARTLAYAMFGQTPSSSFDLHIIRADGSEVDTNAFLSASTAAPGHVINVAVDVSERKAAERDLLNSQAQLERAQSIAHLGSWEISLEHDEIVGSREYWNLVDGTFDGPRNRKLSETVTKIHPDDRERVMAAIERAHQLAMAAEKPAEELVEFRIVRPDGSLRVVTAQGVFSAMTNGDIRGFGVMHDITEIKKAEESARRQREELMRADRMISLGILVSGVAHEINNPNQFITLNAPFLRDAWKVIAPVVDQHATEHPDFRVNGMAWADMSREIPDIIAEIATGAERIRSIVSELKAFGRDQASGEMRPASLNDIIEGSLRLLSNHIRRATTNFSTKLAPNLPPILANPHRIEQVVVNLVMNSCQALERTNQSICVETYEDTVANRVVMRVIDEGRGISPEIFRNIRDPFFTTKRAEGGMGLGLAVSDKIVQEHNGALSFKSEPGRGTTVTLSLPVIRPQEP